MKLFRKAAAFFIILVAVLYGCSFFFQGGKKGNSSGDSDYVRKKLAEQEKNTLQVLVLGDSESYTSISPLQIWNQTGIASYVAGQPGQVLTETRDVLKTGLNSQKLKVVLLETNAMFRSKGNTTGLQDLIASWASKHFSIFRHHNIWKQAFKQNEDWYVTWQGYRMKTKIIPYEKPGDYMSQTKKKATLSSKNCKLVDEIHALCKKNGVQLVLYSSPSPRNYNYAKHNALASFASLRNIPYIDLNIENIGIDWRTDTVDGGDHLNISGAQKVTAFFEGYLSRFGLTDERNNPAFASWNALYKKYMKEVDYHLRKIRSATE